MPRTWTKFTSKCTSCGATFRVSQEIIDEQRRDFDVGTSTDEEIAKSFDFCIECVGGEVVPGEIVCEGAQDDKGPCCEGSPVETYVAREWEGGEWITTRWCPDCKGQAEFLGWEFKPTETVGEAIHRTATLTAEHIAALRSCIEVADPGEAQGDTVDETVARAYEALKIIEGA